MSKNFPPPKVAPEEVVRAALQTVVDEVEDVYPGEQAQEMQAQLLQDPKAVEKWMAGILATLLLSSSLTVTAGATIASSLPATPFFGDQGLWGQRVAIAIIQKLEFNLPEHNFANS